MQRMPDWTVDSLSPGQRKVHDAIVEGPRGAVQGPLRVWLQSPNLAQNAQALARSADLEPACRHGCRSSRS